MIVDDMTLQRGLDAFYQWSTLWQLNKYITRCHSRYTSQCSKTLKYTKHIDNMITKARTPDQTASLILRCFKCGELNLSYRAFSLHLNILDHCWSAMHKSGHLLNDSGRRITVNSGEIGFLYQHSG